MPGARRPRHRPHRRSFRCFSCTVTHSRPLVAVARVRRAACTDLWGLQRAGVVDARQQAQIRPLLGEPEPADSKVRSSPHRRGVGWRSVSSRAPVQWGLQRQQSFWGPVGLTDRRRTLSNGQRSRCRTARRSSTRTGGREHRSSSATAGRSRPMTGMPRCSYSLHHGYRVIAHDRRGHGRSAQVDQGNDMDHYADDPAQLTAHLDLREAVHVGHSAGGGRWLAISAATARAASLGGPHQRGHAVGTPDRGESSWRAPGSIGVAPSPAGGKPLSVFRAVPSGPLYCSTSPASTLPRQSLRTGGARA